MKLSNIAFVIGLTVGIALLWTSMAAAQCAPDGNVNPQNITCSSDDPNGVDGAGGADTITVDNGVTVTGGNVQGGGGSDTIVNNGTVTLSIVGENGDDSLTNNGTVLRISGDDGSDTITNTGTVNNNVQSGADPDTIINMGTIHNTVTGGGGDDTITNSGAVNNLIAGNNDNDVITNTGTASGLDGGGGNDTITNSGTVDTDLNGGSGSDALTNSGTVNSDVRGANGSDTVTNEGTVNSDIQLGFGDDQANINVVSIVGGTINGDVGTDTLAFTGSTPDAAGIAALDTLANACNATATNADCQGTVTFCDNSFTFIGFEQLVNSITTSAGSCDAIVVDFGDSNGSRSIANEIACQNIKVFRTPDGFIQVYSGFDIMPPNGFLVAVFGRDDAQVDDIFSLDDPNTPAWTVEILPDNILNVLDENNAVVGICTY